MHSRVCGWWSICSRTAPEFLKPQSSLFLWDTTKNSNRSICVSHSNYGLSDAQIYPEVQLDIYHTHVVILILSNLQDLPNDPAGCNQQKCFLKPNFFISISCPVSTLYAIDWKTTRSFHWAGKQKGFGLIWDFKAVPVLENMVARLDKKPWSESDRSWKHNGVLGWFQRPLSLIVFLWMWCRFARVPTGRYSTGSFESCCCG